MKFGARNVHKDGVAPPTLMTFAVFFFVLLSVPSAQINSGLASKADEDDGDEGSFLLNILFLCITRVDLHPAYQHGAITVSGK